MRTGKCARGQRSAGMAAPPTQPLALSLDPSLPLRCVHSGATQPLPIVWAGHNSNVSDVPKVRCLSPFPFPSHLLANLSLPLTVSIPFGNLSLSLQVYQAMTANSMDFAHTVCELGVVGTVDTQCLARVAECATFYISLFVSPSAFFCLIRDDLTCCWLTIWLTI